MASSSGGGIMASDVSRKTHDILTRIVPNIFADPSNVPNEADLHAKLFRHLEELWRAKEVNALLQERQVASNFCGKVFKNGEPCVFCRECQTDSTCCLCLDCFEHSEHKNHNYRMFTSGGGGCCDCGDPEAWTANVYCTIHQPTEGSSDQDDPLAHLPFNLVNCAKQFFSTILWYCSTMLSWEDGKTLPPWLTNPNVRQQLSMDTFNSFLLNDESHSYEEVITGLSRHMGLKHMESVELATTVDRKGRAVLAKGTENDCLASKEKINKSLTHSPLNVSVIHSVVVSHQLCALQLLHLLREQATKSAGICRLISMAIIEPSLTDCNRCILDHFFLDDNSLWIEARLAWQKLIMSSIFKDFDYKRHLGINLTKNYNQLAKNFVQDTHDHDVCALNLTVQLFTVPSLCRLLIAEHNVIEVIINTIKELLQPCYDSAKGHLNLHSRKYKHARMCYVMYDLRYILRNHPEEWSDDIRASALRGLKVFFDLLASLQNVDAIKRQFGAHVSIEPPWESSFNFNIILQPAITFFTQWCISDQEFLRESVSLALQRLDPVKGAAFKQHAVDRELVSKRLIELISFNVSSDSISLHQPLPRFIAGLLTGAAKFNLSLPHLLQISPSDSRLPLCLMEPSSRVLVMAAEVQAGMWKRNGYGIINQVMNYQFHFSREVMYDKDIMLLQAMAAVLNPSVFIYALIYKFRLEKWLTNPENPPGRGREDQDDARRFLLTDLEEFLFLVIAVLGERYVPGIGEGVTADDGMRRELIHMLYGGHKPHSQLVKKFRLNENESAVNTVLKKIAVLRRIAGKSVFQLKEECEAEYCPFFYHYSRTEQSQAEEMWRRKKKASQSHPLESGLPHMPPPFTPPYRGILQLTQCPVLLRVLCNVFKMAASESSQYWSVKLVHEALHICAVLLSEEKALGQSHFCRAALGVEGKSSLLPYLEALQSSTRVEERQHLLQWILQHLRAATVEAGGTIQRVVSVESCASSPDSTDGGGDPLQSKRQKLAEIQRLNLMKQMSEMQKKFAARHQNELDLLSTEPAPTSPTSVVTSPTDVDHPSCAVGVASWSTQPLPPVYAICMLCQEESKDVAAEEKAFVLAACVYRSSLLRKSEKPSEEENKVDFLNCHLNSFWGVYTGGCGHVMHVSCWKKFLENKQREHRRRHFFPIPGHSVAWSDGEFLCPLCQMLSNTVLPLSSPALCSSQTATPTCDITMDMWRTLINKAIDQGIDGGEAGFASQMQAIFSSYQSPGAVIKRTRTNSELETVSGVFSQMVFMQAYACPPDDDSKNVPIAQWNNCAFTIAGIEHSARKDNKFVLDSLTPRQLDRVRSLIQLGIKAACDVEIGTLAAYCNQLVNTMIPTLGAFSEYPSLVEMDSFLLLVNLHFTVVALLHKLTSHSPEHHTNPYLPSLAAVTNQWLVQTAMATHLAQWLLCCSPAMDTSDGSSSTGENSPELKVGQTIQELWLQLRQMVCGASNDAPPNPYELYFGMLEHMYPFLQKASLFFYCLTGVCFVHSSASVASNFPDMCKYLSIPLPLPTLLHSPPFASLIKSLCGHPRLPESVKNSQGIPLPLRTVRQLVPLPNDYSTLVKQASQFRCLKKNTEGDDAPGVMLCLLCGELVCTNSFCCQRPIPGDDSASVGGLNWHSQTCGAGFGMALWIFECFVVLLNSTDMHNVRGCTISPPYVDEFGEPDPGLRQGSPLKFNKEIYDELRTVWQHHRLPDKICREMEQNIRLLNIDWSKM